MHLQFQKVHGLGNDFVLLRGDLRDHAWLQDQAAVAGICDRRRGVGADGVLLVSRAENEPQMWVFNADGSRPEMCGNGLRCAARVLLDERGARELVVQTDAGPHEVTQLDDGTMRVLMRAPTYDFARTDFSLPAMPKAIRWTAVNVGNPHIVTFHILAEDERLVVGPLVENHELFPQRVNVNFARVLNRHALALHVFERGVGWTDACGTGACASVVAAMLTDRVDSGQESEVQLPGGKLWVHFDSARSALWMRGPAEVVFSGEFSLSQLRG